VTSHARHAPGGPIRNPVGAIVPIYDFGRHEGALYFVMALVQGTNLRAFLRQDWPLTTGGGQVLSWSSDGREILVATLSGHIVGYPVSTDRGYSFGQPTALVRDIGSAAAYSSATRDHSHILIRVSPDAAKDKGEMRLLFGWQDALRQGGDQ
jgi:hypothetical protein